MAKRRRQSRALAVGATVALALVATGAVTAAALQRGTGWRDDFSGKRLDMRRWVIANGQAPGYIPGYHIGYYWPSHVSLAPGGYLAMLLTQANGPVDSGYGVISKGGLIYTKAKCGYGTYEWRMRMSSTAASPTGEGYAESGSVSAGFIYVNNSQTEIDFEFTANVPGTLYLVNWLNPDPAEAPTEDDEWWTAIEDPDICSYFRTYRFVWQPGMISYYVDGVLKAVHTTNVPSAPAHFMINHWGTDSPGWGGYATIGTPRYFYVDWVAHTPLP